MWWGYVTIYPGEIETPIFAKPSRDLLETLLGLRVGHGLNCCRVTLKCLASRLGRCHVARPPLEMGKRNGALVYAADP